MGGRDPPKGLGRCDGATERHTVPNTAAEAPCRKSAPASAALKRSESMPHTYMLDTNVFNDIVEGRATVARLLPIDGILVVTHIQRDELEATRDEARRERLRTVYGEIAPTRAPTESSIWEISRWDEAEWPSAGGLFDQMLTALDAKEAKPSSKRDILIAETAIRCGHVLVSRDSALRELVEEFGGRAIDARSND